MTLTEPDLYDTLAGLDSDETNSFTLADSVTESDVQTWLDSQDVEELESEADNRIERTTITDLQSPAGIGSDDLSVADVIESRNGDPANYEAAYLIRSNKTTVQYFKPGVGGREPIPASDVDSWLSDHVSEMIDRAVNAELLGDAKKEFGA